MRNETNFVHPSFTAAEVDLFFGPLEAEDGRFLELREGWRMAHVIHSAGLFKSVSEARRNGWDHPVPAGFSSHIFGKSRHVLWILNVFELQIAGTC